jgi:hypothetical protein
MGKDCCLFTSAAGRRALRPHVTSGDITTIKLLVAAWPESANIPRPPGLTNRSTASPYNVVRTRGLAEPQRLIRLCPACEPSENTAELPAQARHVLHRCTAEIPSRHASLLLSCANRTRACCALSRHICEAVLRGCVEVRL